jgi:hypothetical protein
MLRLQGIDRFVFVGTKRKGISQVGGILRRYDPPFDASGRQAGLDRRGVFEEPEGQGLTGFPPRVLKQPFQARRIGPALMR